MVPPARSARHGACAVIAALTAVVLPMKSLYHGVQCIVVTERTREMAGNHKSDVPDGKNGECNAAKTHRRAPFADVVSFSTPVTKGEYFGNGTCTTNQRSPAEEPT